MIKSQSYSIRIPDRAAQDPKQQIRDEHIRLMTSHAIIAVYRASIAEEAT